MAVLVSVTVAEPVIVGVPVGVPVLFTLPPVDKNRWADRQ